MVRAQRFLFAFFFAGITSACETIHAEPNAVSSDHVSDGNIVCVDEVDLGRTQVLVRTDWRPDQKDPEGRKALAMKVIESVMRSVPCIGMVEFEDEQPVGSDTTIEFTLREFGPELIVSMPVIWTSRSHVDASITVTDNYSGEVIFVAKDERREGGAFAIRPQSAVQGTFERLITDWFVGSNTEHSE